MKWFYRVFAYIAIYVLFVILYGLSFENFITIDNLKVCMYSSILPALVGGTATGLLIK